MRWTLLLLVSTTHQLLIAASSSNQCQKFKFFNFGLNSAYSASDADRSATTVAIKGCEVISTFHYIRHGTRWASPSDNSKILSLRNFKTQNLKHLEAGDKITLCSEELQKIVRWTTGVDSITPYGLMEQGERDQLELGRRFAARFPFLKNVQRADIALKHGFTTRTRQSAENFGQGLLGKPCTADGYDVHSDFFRACPKSDIKLAKSKVSGPYKTFQSSKDMDGVIKRVGVRLGLSKGLKFDDIEAMYTSCAFETAWNISTPNSKPAWCTVFEEQDFEVMEYWADLKELEKNGYLSEELHRQIGCRPIQSLYKYFKDVVQANGVTKEKARFYFTHDTLINQIITYLGLYKDTPILGSDAVRKDRKWRVTKFSPFASNIGGALFRCGHEFSVQMFLNERPLPLPQCGGSVCSWKQFTSMFGNLPETCNTVSAC